MRGPPRYRSVPPLQCTVPPRYRSGPLLQCAAPPRYAARALHCNARTASAPLRYRSGPLFQCSVPTPRSGFTKFQLDRSEELPRKHKDQRKAEPQHCSPGASSNGALHTCAKAFQVYFALNHSFWLVGCLLFVGLGERERLALRESVGCCFFLGCRFGRGPRLELFAGGICAWPLGRRLVFTVCWRRF